MEETNEEQPAVEQLPSAPPASSPSLTGDPVVVTPSLTKPETHAQKDVDFDKRFASAESYQEFMQEKKASDEKYEKRIADMRRMVSTKDDFVGDKKEYFQDYAPQERFMKYFEADTPAETKEVMSKWQEGLADKFHGLALNKKQATEVSNTILEILEEQGVLDTRTEEQQNAAKQKWINDQKATLGANAENIIREAKIYLYDSPHFDAKTKNTMAEMMETIGAPFIDVVHQLKNAFGGSSGSIPGSVVNLAGLPSDADLWIEYSKPDTSQVRRDQIIQQRHSAGRTGKLADAAYV